MPSLKKPIGRLSPFALIFLQSKKALTNETQLKS